jgi:protein SCO1/2
MSRLRNIGIGVPLILLLLGCGGDRPWHLKDISGLTADLDFALTDDRGRAVSAADYLGQPVVLYFGYTHCPDVCPTTLSAFAAALHALGDAGANAHVLFVTVDPDRDSVATLRAYASAFGPQFVGLRGTPEQLRALAKRYRIGYSLAKPAADGSYVVTHSSAAFIFDARGRARLLALPETSATAIASDLGRLVGLRTGDGTRPAG